MFQIRTPEPGVVVLSGRLDASVSTEAGDQIRALPGPLTFDCSELEYISSAGISVVMETYKRMQSAGLVLRMTGLQPRVRKVFEYAGLAGLLGIEQPHGLPPGDPRAHSVTNFGMPAAS